MTYIINDKCRIHFNPLSLEFAERLLATYSEMEAIQKSDDCDIITQNKVFREKIDSLFGEPVSDKIFGDHNVFVTAGGYPLWFNFMNAIIQEVDRKSAAVEKIGRCKGKRTKPHKR